LQVLPLAYDVRRHEWYDMAGSAMRHFRDAPDSPFHWRDRVFTFNTACYNCHVSQIDHHYDQGTDTYRTTWTEPGINCETCHGPGRGHVELFRRLPTGAPTPTNLQIISTARFSSQQMNSLCAPCHAKITPITTNFLPGQLFFNHFDLATLEDPDWYPDGRDLGENFTETTWRISPCHRGGQFDCLHCHTSSGRNRFPDDRANQSCLPCHQQRVESVANHSHHPADSPGSRCVSCHMPATEFARMRRSDHSLRPPNPSATLEFGSPNACNLCHTNQTPQWAADWVARWHPDSTLRNQELQRARLIAAARRHDWTQLPAMLQFIGRDSENEIFVAGLIRLLRHCPDNRVAPALRQTLRSTSELVRARAAEGLAGRLNGEPLTALARAARDEVRLVRIRAAEALAGVPSESLPAETVVGVEGATQELLLALTARPDDAASHYNLGNFYLTAGRPDRAATAFEAALRLQSDNVMALVNGALAYNAMGSNELAEANLRRAHTLAPSNSAINLNLGLLWGELGRRNDAELAFRAAWQADTNNAVAAYNLGVILAGTSPVESLAWCRRAMSAAPQEPKYAYTVAFYERQQGRLAEAAGILEELVAGHPTYVEGIDLLGQVYVEQGAVPRARALFQKAARQALLPAQSRAYFDRRARQLNQAE
jgi:tetratricopeptide (TPR) repeat protein